MIPRERFVTKEIVGRMNTSPPSRRWRIVPIEERRKVPSKRGQKRMNMQSIEAYEL